MTDRATRRRDDVIARATALGFARVGIVTAGPSPQAAMFERWLDAGRHGTMKWLAEHRELRGDPRGLLSGARSIICVADRYSGPGVAAVDPDADDFDDAGGPREPGSRGRIARYARGRDYHKTLRRRLHALADALHDAWPEAPSTGPPASSPDERAAARAARFRACTDTAPILERDVAARAGLGRIGKHTLLIEPGVGSWMLLGELLTTVDVAPTEASTDEFESPCGSCTRCLDACPTGCIEPWSVDARRCIAYLTIEHRTRIEPEAHAAIGNWVFGCDVCQEVCPHVRATRRGRRAAVHPDYAPRRASLDLAAMIHWTEADRREVGGGTPMTRAKLPMLRRNALIAAGNALVRSDDPPSPADAARLRAAIDRAAADDDPLVRQTAEDVLGRLGERSA